MGKEILFRCSSLGHLMTESRDKKSPIGKTLQTHLIEKWVQEKYGRKSDVYSRAINKGLMVEDASIALYGRVKGRFFKKNEERISNDFICGTPDLFEGPSIRQATLIPDIKSSWDIFTFFRNKQDGPVNKMYYWQLQGYMALTGADKSLLAYCLIDTPDTLIESEKRKMAWNMGIIDPDAEFSSHFDDLERNMRYDDIPDEDRVIEIEVQRNQADIDRLYQRVVEARIWIETNLPSL